MPAISAAPTMWRPAFVGGPTLGSGLNASLLRKLQIAAYWLDKIFPGYVIDLVQGSPSGSSASGGTHAGPGDAGDFTIRDGRGNNAPTKVYILFSLTMRLLFCLAYVRGQDVNADGRKDDSFSAHCHVIDREGSNKVAAAGIQIMQFLAHQNGLLGGHPDLEATVSSPIPLEAYTDAAFKARFMALAPVAATIAAHTEPQEDDMPRLLLDTNGTGRLITGDGTIAVNSVADAKAIKRILTAAEWDPNSAPVDKVAASEVDVYDRYVRAARGSMSATVAATVDPAVLTAAINTAVDAALSGATFITTTKKA